MTSTATSKEMTVDKASDNNMVDSPHTSTDEETAAECNTSSPSHEVQSEWVKAFRCHRSGAMMQDPVVGSDGYSYERTVVVTATESSSDVESPAARNEGDDFANSGKFYANRALKTIMLESHDLDGDSLQASISRMKHKISESLLQILEPSGATSKPVAKTTTTTAKPEEDSGGESVYLSNSNHVGDTMEDKKESKDQEEGQEQNVDSSQKGLSHTPDSLIRPTLHDALYCPITFNLLQEPVIDPEGYTYERIAIEGWIRTHHTSPITRSPMPYETTVLYPNHAIRAYLEGLVGSYGDDKEEELPAALKQWKDNPEIVIPELGNSTIANSGTVSFPAAPPPFSSRRQRVVLFICTVSATGLLCTASFMYGVILGIWSVSLVITSGFILLILTTRRPGVNDYSQTS